ncbi:hypothetical protein [Hyalangium minutum]|uniref:Protein NO VEIN C-terminal domain-containing protein n=1 Tax=Hyalangium minutum TaxID=394096 RepID=A0A085WFP5_9BACT|nr:hypothetical protein [Hyalangium minutum]KFE66508.1 hypothetical protein DB31_0981 [Hyalangium minutum]
MKNKRGVEETELLREAAQERPGGQQTARKAAAILVDSGQGFILPTAAQRRALLIAFAQAGFVIYGKAFDAVKIKVPIDLTDPEDIGRHLDDLVIYEIKSTGKSTVQPDFRRYFFSLSTAELLVAQNLGKRFKFVFVNTLTRHHVELSLPEVFARARGIYPTWSIQF